MITLHCGKDNSGKEITYDLTVDDSSYRYRALCAKPQLVLKFSLPYYIDIPVGSYCDFQGERFYLNIASNLKKNGTRNIEYDLTMGGDEDKLGIWKMRNSVDGRLKYSMTAKPHEFIEEIVKNINAREGAGAWKVGECLSSNEKTVEFNHSYIDAALQSVATAFETEWEIVNKTISLHKVEYNKDPAKAVHLSYGKGNGFVPGVGRTVESNQVPIKRIYPEGGDRNIDRSKYGGLTKDSDLNNPVYANNFHYLYSSATLRLPPNGRIEFDGTQFKLKGDGTTTPDPKFDATKRRTYITDSQGTWVERDAATDKVRVDAVKEDSLDCSTIYPSRVGKVSQVFEVNAERNFWDFTDTTIPEKLNFNNYIIAGEKATLIFQSGMLAGREFEFTYDHANRRFKIVPQEFDGVTMPSDTFKPEVGNEYAVFGIMLPDEYICDDSTQSGASWDMFRACVKKLYENEEQKFTFSGEMQGLWAKRHWAEVSGALKVGGYILFSDEQFAPTGMLIRITGIKDYVNNPYAPTLEISNSVASSTVSAQLDKIDTQEVAIDDAKHDVLNFARRRFRDAQDTLEMLQGAVEGFGEAVNPVTVQTMAALIGDESLQFRFVNEQKQPVKYIIAYDKAAKQLKCPDGYLQHMTLGIDYLSSSYDESKFRVWKMAGYDSPVLTDGTKKYYLYAVVNKTASNGTFVISTAALSFKNAKENESVGGVITHSYNYYLLVGVLNAEADGDRSFVPLYGFTEILPGRITTDRIVSADGGSFIDLANNRVHIGDNPNVKGGKYIDWNNLTSGQFSLRNATIETRNSNDDVMYSLSGIDGSGRLAKGNITWDKDGNIMFSSNDDGTGIVIENKRGYNKVYGSISLANVIEISYLEDTSWYDPWGTETITTKTGYIQLKDSSTNYTTTMDGNHVYSHIVWAWLFKTTDTKNNAEKSGISAVVKAGNNEATFCNGIIVDYKEGTAGLTTVLYAGQWLHFENGLLVKVTETKDGQ